MTYEDERGVTVGDLREALAQWCNDNAVGGDNGLGRAWDDTDLLPGDKALAYGYADELLAIIRDHTSEYRQEI
jgi:hypothetical protein